LELHRGVKAATYGKVYGNLKTMSMHTIQLTTGQGEHDTSLAGEEVSRGYVLPGEGILAFHGSIANTALEDNVGDVVAFVERGGVSSVGHG
jgi:hypothetical protein